MLKIAEFILTSYLVIINKYNSQNKWYKNKIVNTTQNPVLKDNSTLKFKIQWCKYYHIKYD